MVAKFGSTVWVFENIKYRFSNEEILLRILAFSEGYNTYKGPLSTFLNSYMDDFRNADDAKIEKKKKILERAIEQVYEKALDGEPFPRLSKATIEAIFVGVVCNLKKVEAADKKDVKRQYKALRANASFSIDALKEGLAAPDRVKDRLNTAVALFAEV